MKQLMIDYCMKHTGLPYIWGGDDPMKGFDCSGFAQEFLMAFGAHPDNGKTDHTAQMLHNYFQSKRPNFVRETGALSFYGREGRVTHVGVMLDHKHMFEFGGGGSRTNSESDAIKQNAYGRIRPYNRRSDLVAVILPKYGE